jgi:anaerobic magnesium-protoporphyrin IX monomethyl ester cyclase
MKETSIVLVNPPLSAKEQAGSFADVANIMQPLGIGYIAAVLEKEQFPVRILDCRPMKMTVEGLMEELKRAKPDIIGLTATVLEIARSCDISKELKKALPDSLLVIGGPHVTSLPTETMKNSGFDIGAIGEGEMTMLEIAQHVENNNFDFSDVDGIIYRNNGELKINKPRAYIQDLDSLPFPARHLFPPLSDYSPVPASYIKLPLGHMMTSRGCPFQCIFCDRKVFGNMTRMRSPKNVVDELEELINVHGAKEVKFFDDTFTLDQDRAFKIFDEMERRDIKIPWSCLTRVNVVSRELLFRMKEMGCWQVAFGLESGDQDMLNRMKKGITLEQSRNAVRWTKEAGLNVRAYFVIGMPSETLESISKTSKFAQSLPIDVVTFYTLTLYPGNELYEIAKREGTILHDDYSQYNPIIDVEEGRPAYVPEGMTEKELKIAIAKTHKNFYFRPSYIIRQLLSIRRFDDIVRYWKGFKTIAKM